MVDKGEIMGGYRGRGERVRKPDPPAARWLGDCSAGCCESPNALVIALYVRVAESAAEQCAMANKRTQCVC